MVGDPKQSNPRKTAENSRKLVKRGKELLESSRQALEFSRVVLAAAEERAARKIASKANPYLLSKVLPE